MDHVVQNLTEASYVVQVNLGWPSTSQDRKTVKSAKSAAAELEGLEIDDGLRFGQIRPNIQNKLARIIAHTTARLMNHYKALFEVNTDFFEALAKLPNIQSHAHVAHFRRMAGNLSDLLSVSSQLDRLTEGIKLLDGLFFPVYLERKDQMWNSVSIPKNAQERDAERAVHDGRGYGDASLAYLWPNKSESPKQAVKQVLRAHRASVTQQAD